MIYANDSADVVSVLHDYNRSEVLAAIYERVGLRRYHHLTGFGARQQQWLEHRFPDQSVTVTSLTLDRQRMTAFVSGPRNPGTFFWIDPETELIGMVWIQINPFGIYDIEREFQTLVYESMR